MRRRSKFPTSQPSSGDPGGYSAKAAQKSRPPRSGRRIVCADGESLTYLAKPPEQPIGASANHNGYKSGTGNRTGGASHRTRTKLRKRGIGNHNYDRRYYRDQCHSGQNSSGTHLVALLNSNQAAYRLLRRGYCPLSFDQNDIKHRTRKPIATG